MTTWILLRGLSRESRHWGAFPAGLQAAFPGEPVLAMDLPGNGALHRMASPLRVADYVAYCRAELARRGVAPPYRLLAMSLGAMVAVDWASRYAHDLNGAALINTSLRGFSPFYRRLRAGNYPTVARQALRGRASPAWEPTILRLTSRHPPSGEQTLREWQAYRREYPVSIANMLRQLLAAARYRAPRSAPACPLLILASERDTLVDARCSRALARHWGSDLVLHPTAGHDLPLDDGAWVIAQINAWLNGR